MILSQFYKVRFFRMEAMKSLSDVQGAKMFDWSQRLRAEFISSIKVNLYESGRADSFELVLDDSQFTILDELDFIQKNVKVSIDAGYYGDGNHREIVQNGIITFIDPKFGDKGDVSITINGQDEGLLLASPPIGGGRTFSTGRDTLQTVVNTIAQSRGFAVLFVDPVGARNKVVTETQDATVLDREFLNTLANKHGFKMNVKAGTIIFSLVQKDEKGIEKGEIIREFYYNMGDRTNLLKADIKFPKRGQMGGYQIPQATTESFSIDKSPTAKLGPVVSVTRTPMIVDRTDVKDVQVAGADLTFEGRTLMGDMGLVPGYNANIHGIGKAFSGAWRINQVSHEWGKAGFKTSFKAKRGLVDNIDTDQQFAPEGMDNR